MIFHQEKYPYHNYLPYSEFQGIRIYLVFALAISKAEVVT